ncbi:MAG: hypothetical protein ACOY0T_18935 [Myxococcota bacterium]
MKRKSVGLLGVLAFGLLGSACASADGAGKTTEAGETTEAAETTAQTEQAQTAVYCATSTSRLCWENHTNIQAAATFSPVGTSSPPAIAFTDAKGRPDRVLIDDPAGAHVGFLDFPNGLPIATRWITSYSATGGVDIVLMLGSDSVLRSSSGAAWKRVADGGTNFGRVRVVAEPIATTGEPLVIDQVVATYLPNIFASSPTVVALASKKLYELSGTRWRPAAHSPALQAFASTLKFVSISRHTGPGGGATFLTDTGDVWRAMTGVMDQSGKVTYALPLKANPLVVNGVLLRPRALGGRYIVTNAGNGTCAVGGCSGDDDRIYSYDFSTGLWSRFNGGALPYYPLSISDLGTCTTTSGGSMGCDPLGVKPAACGQNTCFALYPYYGSRIIDVPGGGVALRHRFSWIFRYRP